MSCQSTFQTRPETSLPFAGGRILQRSCDCGQHTIGGGRCDDCSKKSLQRLAASDAAPTASRANLLSSPGGRFVPNASSFRGRYNYDLSQVGQTASARLSDSHGVNASFASGDRNADAGPVHTDGIGEDDPIHRPMIEETRRGMGLPETGVDEFGNRVGPSEGEIKYGRQPGSVASPAGPTTPPAQSPRVTPCPASVTVGAIAQRNHSNLSASEKETWGTWLGAMSRMDVGPGPDHTGHCMKERLTTVSNTCPAAVYSRGSTASQPCSGDRCLDINRYGNMWGLSDGPTAFLDMHRTRAPQSLLEGTGVSSCTVVCEQTYSCDRTQPTTGTFRITRNMQASSHTKADGTTMHVTTGTVTKT